MAFIEERLLDCPGFGYIGGPGWDTDIVEVRSGYESRNANWSQTRHRYEIGMTARVKSQFVVIRAAFMRTRGRLKGFRFKDFHDFECAAADGVLIPILGGEQAGTAGEGYGVPTYQLAKVYEDFVRDIVKPISTGLIVYQDGTPITVSLSTSTGIVTITASQTRVISAHTIGAAHIIDLASAFSPNFSVGDRVYISGATGTAASLLNGLSHEITNVAADLLTINVNTTGLTASGGTASFFPQSANDLTWEGQFDVPVRFDTDKFDAVILDRQGGQGELIIELPSVPLVETRDIA